MLSPRASLSFLQLDVRSGEVRARVRVEGLQLPFAVLLSMDLGFSCDEVMFERRVRIRRSSTISSRVNPTRRDNAIMLAFGLGCSLVETQRLLRLAGVSELWPKIRRDAIIIWSIKEGLSREECDDELWRLGEKTLFSVRDDA